MTVGSIFPNSRHTSKTAVAQNLSKSSTKGQFTNFQEMVSNVSKPTVIRAGLAAVGVLSVLGIAIKLVQNSSVANLDLSAKALNTAQSGNFTKSPLNSQTSSSIPDSTFPPNTQESSVPSNANNDKTTSKPLPNDSLTDQADVVTDQQTSDKKTEISSDALPLTTWLASSTIAALKFGPSLAFPMFGLGTGYLFNRNFENPTEFCHWQEQKIAPSVFEAGKIIYDLQLPILASVTALTKFRTGKAHTLAGFATLLAQGGKSNPATAIPLIFATNKWLNLHKLPQADTASQKTINAVSKILKLTLFSSIGFGLMRDAACKVDHWDTTVVGVTALGSLLATNVIEKAANSAVRVYGFCKPKFKNCALRIATVAATPSKKPAVVGAKKPAVAAKTLPAAIGAKQPAKANGTS